MAKAESNGKQNRFEAWSQTKGAALSSRPAGGRSTPLPSMSAQVIKTSGTLVGAEDGAIRWILPTLKPGSSPDVGRNAAEGNTHPTGRVTPELRGSVVIVLHLQLLPGPRGDPHVEEPGVFEELHGSRCTALTHNCLQVRRGPITQDGQHDNDNNDNKSAWQRNLRH